MKMEELINSLNKNQKEAVEAIDGCVMVVAGPGTGKTQVLGARVAHILKTTDTNAENILCLTFTEAATVALRNRLYQFVGSESHKVNIYTYHGFCNTVIQENKDLFGIQDLKPISELETIEILKRIIDDLPNNSLLKRFTGDVYYDVKTLRKLFGLMKKDGYTSNSIKKLVAQRLEDVKNDPKNYYSRKSGKFNKGDFKINTYNAIKEGLDKLIEASELFNTYELHLKNAKRYDFDDMLSWVLKAFKSNEDLLLRYQENYLYFLVDEYQDTNGVQNDLLYTLINYWENPNVFVVGDDDQSIYKFQGANVENIFQFYKKYSKYAKLVVLDENYRSSQNILDGSNKIIKHNNERLVGKVENLNKLIVASNPDFASIKDALNIIEYPNTFQEIVSITTKLKQLKSKNINLKDVGILYRNHNQSDDLIKFLEAEGISYNIARSQDVLAVPIIRQLNSLLTYLDLESKNLDSGQHLLFEILHFNNFKHLSAFHISQISTEIYRRRVNGWRLYLNTIADELKINAKAKAELKLFVSDVEYWLKEMHNLTLQSLIERVMSKMGFVARALANKEATFRIQCLKTYYNFLKEETARQPFLSLSEFLFKIELLIKNNLGLRLNKIVHGENGVNLMTVHGSKGLEFDYVFLLGCTENKWEKDKNNLPFKLNEIIVGEPKEAAVEESRRLFYVALTRAKKHIEVSYALKNENEKELSKSLYVVELEESGAARITKEQAQENELLHFFDFMLTTTNDRYLALTKQDFVLKEVENFRMSATNLNSYLRCPVSFFYQNIIRVPSAKGDSMTFGTAVHYALDGLFKDLENIKNKEKATELLDKRFSTFMNNNKESFTEEGLERRMHYGKTILSNYFNYYIDKWNLDCEIETELYLKHCEIDGVPIRGQIDKVEIFDNKVNVVDFKTGQYKYGKGKVKPPTSLEDNPEELNYEKRFGGDYWRQVMFYKALIESDGRTNLEVISGEIDFVEPDNKEHRKSKIMINSDEYLFVKKQIKTTYEQIMNLEFDKGCEKEDCVWCNFNKHYLGKKEFRSENLLSNQVDEIDER